jgi:hypothetical protein
MRECWFKEWIVALDATLMEGSNEMEAKVDSRKWLDKINLTCR